MKKLKTTITENIDGKFILLSNDAIAQNILEGKRWEPHFSYITSKLLKTGNIAIDVGANFGYHTISLSNLVGDSGKVYSFEPQTIIFYQLCGNIFLNGLMNVIPQNLAVGDVSCEVSMNPVDYFAGWVNIGDTSVASIGNSISCEPLDYCLPTEEKIDFIKIDVQGYECKVLEGASEILKMDKPYLFIEIEENQLNKFGKTSNDLIDLIKSFGYRLFNVVNDYPCDHICIHSSNDVSGMLELINNSDLYTLKEV